MVDNAQNDTKHQFTGLCEGIGASRTKNGSKTAKFEQKRLRNGKGSGLKIPRMEQSHKFFKAMRQIYT